MINSVINESELTRALESTDPNDEIRLDFTPLQGFQAVIDGRKAPDVTLDLNGRSLDGGLEYYIQAAYDGKTDVDIWGKKKHFIFQVKDSYGFKIKNGELFNCGRAIHNTGDADDLTQSFYGENIKVHHTIERGLGGPQNNQYWSKIHGSYLAMMNYNGLMLKRFGDESGWPLTVGPYEEWGTDKPTHGFYLENAYFEYCFGETVGTFHNDHVEWHNVIFYNASPTAFMYAQQGKRIIAKNILCVADDKAPARAKRKSYAFMIASESKPRWPMHITIDQMIVYGSGFEAALQGWMKVDVGLKLELSNSILSAPKAIKFGDFGNVEATVTNTILDGELDIANRDQFKFINCYEGAANYAKPYGLNFEDYKNDSGYGYQFDEIEQPTPEPDRLTEVEEKLIELEAMIQGYEDRIIRLESRQQLAGEALTNGLENRTV